MEAGTGVLVEGGGDACGHHKKPEHIVQSSCFIGGDVFSENFISCS